MPIEPSEFLEQQGYTNLRAVKNTHNRMVQNQQNIQAIKRLNSNDFKKVHQWDNPAIIEAKEQRGEMTPDVSSAWKTLSRRVVGGAVEWAGSHLNTLNKIDKLIGEDPLQFAAAYRRNQNWQRSHQQFSMPQNIGMSHPSWWTGHLGGNIPQMAAITAEMYLSAGILSGIGASANMVRIGANVLPAYDMFMQTAGDETDRIMNNTDLSFEEAAGAALFSSLLQTAIEFMPGTGIPRMRSAITAGFTKGLSQTGKKAAYKSFAKRFLYPSGNILKNSLLTATGESIEEGLQLGVQHVTDLVLSGKSNISPADYVESMFAALPAGALFGTLSGVIAAKNEHQVSSILKHSTDQEMAIQAQSLFKPEVQKKFSKNYNKFITMLKNGLPEVNNEDINQIAPLLENMIWTGAAHLSMDARQAVDPSNLLKDLDIVFKTDTRLTDELINIKADKDTSLRDKFVEIMANHDIDLVFRNIQNKQTANKYKKQTNKQTQSKSETQQIVAGINALNGGMKEIDNNFVGTLPLDTMNKCRAFNQTFKNNITRAISENAKTLQINEIEHEALKNGIYVAAEDGTQIASLDVGEDNKTYIALLPELESIVQKVAKQTPSKYEAGELERIKALANNQKAMQRNDFNQPDLDFGDSNLEIRRQERQPQKPVSKVVDESVVQGIYIPSLKNKENAVMAFWQNADTETVLHEFMHHMIAQNYITGKQRSILISELDLNNKITAADEDKIINSFMDYVMSGKVDNPRLLEVFADVAPVLEAARKKLGIKTEELSEKQKKALGGILLFDKDEISVIQNAQAEAIKPGIEQSAIDFIVEAYKQREINKDYNSEVEQTPRFEKLQLNTPQFRQEFHTELDKYKKTTGKTEEQIRTEIKNKVGKSHIQQKNAPKKNKQLSDMSTAELVQSLSLLRRENAHYGIADAYKKFKKVQREINIFAENLQDNVSDWKERQNIINQDLKNISSKYADLLTGQLENAPNVDEIDTTTASNPFFQFLKTAKNTIRGVHYRKMQTLATLTQQLDRKLPSEIFTKLFTAPMFQTDIVFATMKHQMEQRLSAFVKEKNIDLTNIYNTQVFTDKKTGKKIKLTGSQMIFYYLEYTSKNNERIRNTLQSNRDIITPDTMKQAANAVRENKALREFANFINNENTAIYNNFNKMVTATSGRTMGRVPTNYILRRRLTQGRAKPEIDSVIYDNLNMEIESVLHGEQRKSVPEPTPAKERAYKSVARLDDDAVELFFGYQTTAFHYIAKARAIQVALQTLNQNKVKSLMRDKFGDDMAWNTLRDMIYREHSLSGKLGEQGFADEFFRHVKTMGAYAYLGANPLSAARAASSFIHSLHSTDILKSLNTGAFNFYQAMTHATNERPLAHLPEVQEMYKDFPYLYDRFADPTIQDISRTANVNIAEKDVSRGGHLITFGGKKLSTWMMQGMRIADNFAVATSYINAKRYYIEKHKDSYSNMQELVGDAKEYGATVVMKTQPSSLKFEKTLMQTGGEMERSFIPFTGMMFKNYQFYVNEVALPLVDSVMQAKGLTGKLGAGFKTLKSTGALRKLTFQAAIPALVMGMLWRKRAPDEKEFLTDLLMYPFSQIPIAGSVLDSGVKGWDTELYSGLWVDILETVADVAGLTIEGIVPGDATAAHLNMNDVYRSIALLTGTPYFVYRVFDRQARSLFMEKKAPNTLEYIRRNVLIAPKSMWESEE